MALEFEALGKPTRQPSKRLETFPAPPFLDKVSLVSDEVTSLCPITGQPDWETVSIDYLPDKLCLESKSLKLYFWSFRNEGAFCEALASQIAGDVFAALQPLWCTVTIHQRARGGITITATATRRRE
jgi:7-cyano-7-deazaguanine reductase